jgi:ABC-type antimicrobial peptide transport system ATPase subunit
MTEEIDIWKESQKEEPSTEKAERTLIIIGEPESGKSTIACLLSGVKSTDKKTSYIIDYTYGKSQSITGAKQILHIYEIGESTNSPQILESISSKLTTNFAVIIAANLANPGKAYYKLMQQLENISEILHNNQTK